MTPEGIIESIQAEIARLEQVRTLLSGRTPTQQSADDRSGRLLPPRPSHAGR